MDRLVAAVRSLRSSSESVLNGMCGVLALAAVRLYSALPLRCPCVPGYNALYGTALLLLPAATLFLCGVALNPRWLLLLREWRRPVGGRPRDPAALRYLLLGVVRGAALPPAAWIIVALLDGKCVACALATRLEPGRFANVSGYPEAELRAALARVPCKDLAPGTLARPPPFPRKAAYRYLRTVSQALGWTTLFLLILSAFLARSLRPCSPHNSFLQSWYWGNYLDLEQKVFEDMCSEHAQALAQRSVGQFFLSVQSTPGREGGEGGEEGEGREHLHSINNKDQLDLLLQRWNDARPPLAVGAAGGQTARVGGLSPHSPEGGGRHTQV